VRRDHGEEKQDVLHPLVRPERLDQRAPVPAAADLHHVLPARGKLPRLRHPTDDDGVLGPRPDRHVHGVVARVVEAPLAERLHKRLGLARALEVLRRIRGEDAFRKSVFGGETGDEAAVGRRGEHDLAAGHAGAEREVGDGGVHRQKIGADRRDPHKLGLQPLGVAEMRHGGTQRWQGVGAEPGPEAFEQHVGLQERPVDVQDKRLHLGHLGTLILSRRRRSRRSPAPAA